MIRGQLYVISAPSGAGKTSLIKALRARMPELGLSVSHTTRAMRPGEQDGVHYHFVDVATFEAMITEGAFVEHAQVFGNYYGTSQAAISRVLAGGQDLILEIDWQGAQQVRAQFPTAISVFVLPPSRAALRERLFGRGQDDAEVIARRLAEATLEMRQHPHYDYLIINEDFSVALEQLGCIFVSSRLRMTQQVQVEHARLENLLNTPETP